MLDSWLDSIADDLNNLSELIAPSSAKTVELLPGERREVAILFMDLKGFTTISEKMDHEQLHKVMFGVMKTLANVIEQHGGYVDKFEGDLIMALFGAKHASENDSIRAVQCGLTLFRTLREVNTLLKSKIGIELGARVGINFGWVTVAPDPSGHLTAMGDDVNTASRMESTAQVNTVQVTEAVRRECGNYFSWEDLGKIAVKGREQLLHTYRPTGFGNLQQARWERSESLSKTPLISREVELTALLNQWSAIQSSKGRNPRNGAIHQVVCISGEAGLGKTRLVHEFEKKIITELPMIAHGFTTYIAQSPYWLWINLLRSIFGIKAEDAVAGRLNEALQQFIVELPEPLRTKTKDVKPYILSLFDASFTTPEIKQLEPKARHLATKIAIRDLLVALSHRHPQLVFVLDDLHWVDTLSKDVLEFVLANSDTEQPLYFALCFRHECDDGTRFTLAVNEHYCSRTDLVLQPFTTDEMRLLTTTILQQIRPGAIALPENPEKVLFDYSQGFPFYLEELLLDWIETGKLVWREQTWTTAGDLANFVVPTSVASLLRARMDRLDDDERKTLQHGAVLGFEFTYRLFSLVKQKFATEFADETALSNLVYRNFLKSLEAMPEKSYRFRLTMTQSVVYKTILQHNLKIYHRVTAESIEELSGSEREIVAGLLSYHWEMADQLAKSVDYGIQSLKLLKKLYANREAIDLAEHLLELIQQNQELISEAKHKEREVILAYESICDLIGNRTRQRVLINQLTPEDPSSEPLENLLETMVREGNFYFHTGEIEIARDGYLEILQIAKREHDHYYIATAAGNLGLISMRQQRFEEALTLLKIAVEDYHNLARSGMEAQFLYNLAGVHFSLKQPNDARNCLDRALTIFQRLRNRREIANVTANLAGIMMQQGDADGAITATGEAMRQFREIGDRKAEGIATANLGWMFLQQQRYDEAEAALVAAEQIHHEVDDTVTLKNTLANLERVRNKV